MSTSSPEAFRRELREWLDANFTPEVREALHGADEERFDAHRKWNAALVDAGYGAIAWPSRFGGRDAGLEEKTLIVFTSDHGEMNGAHQARLIK